MKLFKWHLIDDIELRCYENGLIKELKKKVDFMMDENYKLFLENKKLEEENINLKRTQKIEIRDIDGNYIPITDYLKESKYE